STPSARPGPPPVLTRRGADILVRVEKMLEEASKTAGRTSSNEPAAPSKPRASALAFPESFASASDAPAATPPAAPASRKN
ncbi:MAG: penicillin-binding protein, partial [Tardiphaga sp.]|nr:penicillin-binding protein [Tardiphaga sp.]